MACSLKQSCVIDDVAAVQKYLFPEEETVMIEEDDDEVEWKEDSWADDWDTEQNKADDRNSDETSLEFVGNWLTKCRLAFSPTFDLLAIAHGDKLVLLSARSDSGPRSRADGPRRYKVSNQLELSDDPGEYITSILCVPLVSLKKTSHGSVDWSCVVVGFSSGYVRMYTETGDQLISQLLHESAVVEIRCRTHDPMVLRRSVSVTDQPDEVTILYGDAIILLEGFSLFQTLRACRSQVALAAASGGMTIEPPPLSYKKWRLTGNQGPISSHISPGVLTPNPFDQMRTASVLGGFSAEIRGTAPAMSCFVATGSSPFTGFYYAVEEKTSLKTLTKATATLSKKPLPSPRVGKRKRPTTDPGWEMARKRRRLGASNGSAQPHLSHVAFAVASKLKSALYSSASRWLAWGTGAQQEPATQQKAQTKLELGSPLDIRCGMPDPLRHGDDIVLAPGAHLASSALATTTDSFGRVILFDVHRAIALRMWKGYRDAQVGFMRVFDDAHRGHKHHHDHSEAQKTLRRHALFLIIYAPRRGLLEVWSCVNGPRVGAFNVSKNARLLCPGYGMMGLNTGTMSGTTSHTFQCCLLEANGQVREIRIPFHLALSDANSKKARDMHLLKKLNLILHSRRKTGEEAVKILLEIRISGMVRQALEKLLHTRKIGAETFRNCITAIQQRLKEGGVLKKADNDLLKYCEAQLKLIDLYDAVQKLNDMGNLEAESIANDIENVTNVDTMCNLLHMTRTEATEALSAVARFCKSQLVPRVQFDTGEKPSMDVAEFLNCFLVDDPLSKSMDGAPNWDPELHVSESSKLVKLAAFLFHSSLFGSSAADNVLFTLNGSIDLAPRTVLDLLFKYWLTQDNLITHNLTHCLGNLYSYVESCSKKSLSAATNLRSELENDADLSQTDSASNSESHAIWEWVRDDVCATSHNTIAAYLLAVVARAVAIASNAQDNKEKNDSENGDDWEKMQVQDAVEEEAPPSYEESCTGENSKPRSGDWETLWIDVEKWNLFVHQLEDSILINTCINLGKMKRGTPTHETKEKRIDESTTQETAHDSVSVKDLLSNGPGFMAELVSHSICELKIPPHCVEKGSVDDLRQNLNERQNMFLEFLHQVLYTKFPYSLAPDCLHSHCFWEHMVEWNKEPLEMPHFSTAIEHLRLVSSDTQARHGLALMAWRTFVAKRYAALAKLVDKVGKAPKDRLCRKEVGISDTLMPSFCQACTEILQIVADADLDDNTRVADSTSSATLISGAEDPWQNVTGKRSIMDMGRAHPQANRALVQHNMDLSFILHGTMQFLLRGVKPLSALFDRRGKACFALDLATRDPTLPNPDTIEPEVSKARQQFLTKVVSAAVQQLASHIYKKDSDTQRSVTMEQQQELEKWIETAIHMAAEFQISVEKIKMHHVDGLFKNGLDAIGLEACTTVADKEVLSSSLVLIVGQRLSYILLHANPDDGVIMMSRMSPTLSTWIRSQDSSVLRQPDVPISDTLTLARTVLTMMSEKHSLYSIALSLEEAASSMAST